MRLSRKLFKFYIQDMAKNLMKKPEKEEEQEGLVKEEPKQDNGNLRFRIGSMKNGDYMVHVFIQEGKNFILGKDVTVDPLIEVNCLKNKQYSTTKTEVVCGQQKDTIWNEHLFFEFRNMYSLDIENATIEINIRNKGFFKDELIGSFVFNVSSIYYKDTHAIQHQWVAMFNPESEDLTQITANLKVSIHVMGKGDEQIQLCVQSEPDKLDAQLMMPAQVQQDFKQLKIKFLTADNLPKLDSEIFNSDATMDVYFETSILSRTIKTKYMEAVKGSADVDQEFWIPIKLPLTNDRLIIKCKDHDDVGSDNIAGTLVFKINDLIELGERPGGTWKWQNLYGAPIGYSGKNTNQMNENPELASQWHGRVLIHISVEATKAPKLKVGKIDPIYRKQAIDRGMFNFREFDMIAEIGQGISLPEAKIEYTVLVRVANMQIQSDAPKEGKDCKNYNRWSFTSVQQTFKSQFQSLDELDHVFVYLMKGKVPVCFWRGNVLDFAQPNPAMRWIVLKNDLSVGEVKNNYEAGMIQIRLSINSRAQSGPVNYLTQKNWQVPQGKGKSRRLISYRVRLFIFQCRNIPSADDNGLSDCYIRVWNQDPNRTIQTSVCNDTLNPIFYETLDFFQDMGQTMDSAPPIILNLWDQDGTFVFDDYLGMALLHLNKPASNIINIMDMASLSPAEQIDQCNKIPTPSWIDIHAGFDDSGPQTGQILCSAVVAMSDMVFKPADLVAMVPKKEYDIFINVLGLRDLQSSGILPVRQAYLRLDVKSMLPPSVASAAQNIETAHNTPGPNPNLNTAIKFTMQLPVDELYCPSLTCEVFDYIFLGLSQPLIGSFTIPIGEIKAQTLKDQAVELELCDRIVDQLTQVYQSASPDVRRYTQQCIIDQKKKIETLSPEAVKLKAYRGIQEQMNQIHARASPQKEMPKGYSRFDDEEEIGADQIDLIVTESIAEKKKNQQELLEQKLDSMTQAKLQKKKTVIGISTNKDEEQRAARKNLIEEKLKLKEIKKSKRAVERELDQQEMNQQKIMQSKAIPPILLPKYQTDPTLGFAIEVDPPKTSVYKTVGFNDQATIRSIVKVEKDSGFDQKLYDHLNEKNNLAIQLNQTSQIKQTEECDRKAQRQQFKQVEQKKIEITKKHYRIFYEDELENNRTLFPRTTFQSYDLMRGQTRGNTASILDIFKTQKRDQSGQIDTSRSVGRFKGLINVINQEEYDNFKTAKRSKILKVFGLLEELYKLVFSKPLKAGSLEEIAYSKKKRDEFWESLDLLCIDQSLFRQLFNMQKFDATVSKDLLQSVPAVVNLYMLEGFDFASHDIGSNSDPYLTISCGDMVYNERDNYQTDQPNPKFNKLYSFSVTFPGPPNVVITAYDYDALFGDDLIGKTTIDLDDRFYSVDWQALKQKPIEQRQLYHPSCNLSQGVVSCWLEIEPSTKEQQRNASKKWDLTPEPVQKFQLRVAVMDCTNVPTMDIEGTTDLYIRVFIDDKDKKSTDTHYRCMSGNGSFNYRCMMEFETPRENYLLTLQAWDRDLLSSNECICEWTLDLKTLIQIANYQQTILHLDKKFYEKFMAKERKGILGLEFSQDNPDTFYLTVVVKGKKVKIGLDIRCGPKATIQTVVGEGREAPNFEPYLPPPVGRIKFSWNPLTMLLQLVSKEFLEKICWIVCAVLCCVALISMIPLFFTQLVSLAISHDYYPDPGVKILE